jgi:polar amino acid transport system permease protein
MSSGQTMRRIVLPQAMRVIVPPTGNETIAMVKDTSLHRGDSIITELYYQASSAQRSFKIMPGLRRGHALVPHRVFRSSWSASRTWRGTSAAASVPCPRRPKQKIMKIEADH